MQTLPSCHLGMTCFTCRQAAEQVEVHSRLPLSGRRWASADQPTQILAESWVLHLLEIGHTMDSDAWQVSNCVEEELADIFLMFLDRPAHDG